MPFGFTLLAFSFLLNNVPHMPPIHCPAFFKPLPEVVDCPLHDFSISVCNFFGYSMLEFIYVCSLCKLLTLSSSTGNSHRWVGLVNKEAMGKADEQLP